MTTRCHNIPDLVVRMQDDFLESSELRLTPGDAERRFNVDAVTCAAVLNAPVDAPCAHDEPGRSLRQTRATHIR